MSARNPRAGHRLIPDTRVYPRERRTRMKVIAILLLVAGVVGLILSALFPALCLAGILGAVAALLSGLGFLLMGRYRPYCQR